MLQRRGNEFYDIDYKLPENLTRGKDKITLKFAARPGESTGSVSGVRLLKENM